MAETRPAEKTIVVTGAASGIGRALAQGFAADGYAVIGGDSNEEGLASLPTKIHTRVTDVSCQSEVESLIELAIETTGRIDVLFNNAGYGLPYSIEDMPPDAFERLVAVHLFGSLHGIRAAIPRMRAQNGGHVIITLSRAAEFHAPGGSAYNAAKAAQWALTRTAANELKGSGILVNGLIPGMTNTAIWGRDRPKLQPPEAVYPHARWMADFPPDGPTGQVFWDSKPYVLGDPENLAARSH